MKRKAIRPISKKLQTKLPEYRRLVDELKILCMNRSELSGESPIEPHHIMGRIGDRLTDVWNIILLTRNEHNEQDGNTYEQKQELLGYVKIIRLRQGYKKEGK